MDTPTAGPLALSGRSPAAAPAPASAPAAATAGSGPFSFHALMEDLNPLQYIPVVGIIYRAVTGDEGNPTLRFLASLGTSFALGGPAGLGITVAEKVTGIDPETIGRHLLARLLHPSPAKPPASPSPAAGVAPKTADAAPTASLSALPPPDAPANTSAGAPGSTSGSTSPPAPAAARAWTAGELSAYGVSRTANQELVANGQSGADVLNTLELRRLSGRTV